MEKVIQNNSIPLYVFDNKNASIDPVTKKCISTSDQDQLFLKGNIEIMNMLRDINVTSIQMQSGLSLYYFDYFSLFITTKTPNTPKVSHTHH